MKRRTLLLRSCMIALGLIALASFAKPTTASAQFLFPCVCDRIVVTASPDNQCRFIFCVRTGGGERCDTILPGTTVHFPCNDQAHVYVKDCNGNNVHIPVNGCVDFAPRPGCCLRACLKIDDNGCAHVRVGPSPVDCTC